MRKNMQALVSIGVVYELGSEGAAIPLATEIIWRL